MSMGDTEYIAESEGEKDMFKLANETWGDYKERFVPLENELISRSESIQGKRPQVTGRAAAETRHQYDSVYNDRSVTNTIRGADPSSGAAMMGLGDISVDEAKSQSGAVIRADQSVDDAYYGGQRRVMAMGQGIRSGSMGLAHTSATLDANAARIAQEAAASKKLETFGAAGTGAGIGLSFI